ncbi:hypothetical protein C8J57DRAFT_1459041 [Mycena rebaudengoi]|nr:hypothetical protein C8J57DRAFT_1459041 [Mycena rebaudengoi]
METESPKSLPRTTHALPHAQRLRLLRSTRKVGAILGETPLLEGFVSSPTAPTFASSSTGTLIHRPVYIYTPAPRSSSLAAASSSSSSSSSFSSRAPIFPPGLEPRPAPAPRPPSEDFSFSFPATTAPDPADERRRFRTRKMAKVVRTLGENVPAELVFPPARRRSRRSSTASSRRRRRDSRASLGEDGANVGVRGENPNVGARHAQGSDAQPDEDSASEYSSASGEWVRVDRVDVMPTLGEASPSTAHGTPPWGTGAPPTYSADTLSTHSASSSPVTTRSPESPWGAIEPQATPPTNNPLAPPPMAIDTTPPTGTIPDPPRSPFGGIRRREDGWSGEWAGSKSLQSMDQSLIPLARRSPQAARHGSTLARAEATLRASRGYTLMWSRRDTRTPQPRAVDTPSWHPASESANASASQKCCQVTDLDRAELMERAENQTSADGSSLSALNTASAHRNPFLEAV